MKTFEETFRRLIEDCNIIYKCENGAKYIVSKEVLMHSYVEFLLKKSDERVVLSLNTNSLCYEIINLLYVILTCIYNNDVNDEELIRSLKPGDIVIYDGKRQSFVEISKAKFQSLSDKVNEYVVLESSGKTYVPKKLWNNIQPYYGEAGKGAHGVRRKNKNLDDFYTQCLGFNKKEIVHEFGVSSVLVTGKENFIDLYKNVEIEFAQGKTIELSSLVTATYYPDSETAVQIGSNPTKSEAVIKVTGTLSTARKLIKDKHSNPVISVLITDIQACNKELDMLLDVCTSKGLYYSLLSLPIESDFSVVTEQLGDSIGKYYGVTRDFVNEYYDNAEYQNNVFSVNFFEKIENIKNRELTITTFDLFDDIDRNYFRSCIKLINSSEFDSDDKKEFVIQSYSLWSLFENAPFNISIMEEMIANNKIRPSSPIERINHLAEISKGFPVAKLRDKANFVVDTLRSLYGRLLNDNPKAKFLRDEIISYGNNHRIALVVNRPYFKTIIENDLDYSAYLSLGLLKVYTPERFDNRENFDEIITFGPYCDNKFNLNSCVSSKYLSVLLYGSQKPIYEYYENIYKKREFGINVKSTLKYPYASYSEESLFKQLEEEVVVENDLLKQINELRYKNSSRIYYYGNQSYVGPLTDTVKTVFFYGGGQSYFTKNYKPFYYDETKCEVYDKSVDDLSVGDTLIFTKNDSAAVDIVDGILQEIISLNDADPEMVDSYEKSKHWKKALQEYMKENSIDTVTMAKNLKHHGVTVEILTIMGWLDENTQTVKPRDRVNLEFIADYIGDTDLLENVESYYNAGDLIYDARRKIKNEIKTAYGLIVTGGQIDSNSILFNIQEKISQMFETYTIEHINEEMNQIPNNKANRVL